MSGTDAVQADLAELRTIVLRAREQALEITLEAQQTRAGLREEAERIRAERERAERELREDVRRGAVPGDRRELAERLVRGDLTWRDLLTGEEGAEVRSDVGDRVQAVVEDLRASDTSFRDRHDAVLRMAHEAGQGGR